MEKKKDFNDYANSFMQNSQMAFWLVILILVLLQL